MEEDKDKQTSQIHVRVNQETREQWLAICDILHGNTQSKIFKNIISKIYSNISEMTNINSYGTEA